MLTKRAKKKSHRFFWHLAHSHTPSSKINSEHFWLWQASSSQPASDSNSKHFETFNQKAILPVQVTNSFNLSSSTLASQWTHLSDRLFDEIFLWLTLLQQTKFFIIFDVRIINRRWCWFWVNIFSLSRVREWEKNISLAIIKAKFLQNIPTIRI